MPLLMMGDIALNFIKLHLVTAWARSDMRNANHHQIIAAYPKAAIYVCSVYSHPDYHQPYYYPNPDFDPDPGDPGSTGQLRVYFESVVRRIA